MASTSLLISSPEPSWQRTWYGLKTEVLSLKHWPYHWYLEMRLVRYVGVIRFILHVLKLLPIRFTKQTHVAFSKFIMKHLQKPIWKLDLPSFDCNCWKCMFISFLTRYVSPPNMFTIKCRVVIDIWPCNPNTFNMCLYDVALWTSLNPVPNVEVRWRERAT